MFLFRPFILLIFCTLISCANAAQTANKYDRISSYLDSQREVTPGDHYIAAHALAGLAKTGDHKAEAFLDKWLGKGEWQKLDQKLLGCLEREQIKGKRELRSSAQSLGLPEKPEYADQPGDEEKLASTDDYPSLMMQMVTLTPEMARVLCELGTSDYLAGLRNQYGYDLAYYALGVKPNIPLLEAILPYFPPEALRLDDAGGWFRKAQYLSVESVQELQKKGGLSRLNARHIQVRSATPVKFC